MNRLSKLTMLGTAAALLSGCASWPGNRAATPNPCQDLTVSIYFQRDSAAITREARAVLKGAGEMARGCVLGQVDVTGLADSVGDPDVNLALSQRRAESIRGAVERLGFTTVNFNVGAVGENGATTASGADRPLRRRADVTFHLRPH
ncbi:MAG: OmpA family protein [Caulobacterales bacterium]|nr:OmpA family protein [Caulobacterales bacterium]